MSRHRHLTLLRAETVTPQQAVPPRNAPASNGRIVAALVRAAAAGDDDAWRKLVTRFTPGLRAAVRGFRLPPADVDDVVQDTWLAAFRYLGRIQKPEAIGAWLLVTARRESLRTLQRGTRELVTADIPTTESSELESPEYVVLETERRETLQAVVANLPDSQRLLLGALLRTSDQSYNALALELNMPIGSIGPTRARALQRLRRELHPAVFGP
jgi:RNA polymerase sigma factor (sigma-70 family)